MTTSVTADLTRRKTPRQARSTVTVDAIFDATLQVLLATGSTRLNTTLVSHRAGVSVGTLYQYFPNKQALLLAVLERHLSLLTGAVENACQDHRGQSARVMAEAVATAYLRAKAQQHEVSRALYLIAAELDANASIGAATRRAEQAIAEMLLTAKDRSFPDTPTVARVLLAALSGAVRVFYERNEPIPVGGDVEQELVRVCRTYLQAAGQPNSTRALRSSATARVGVAEHSRRNVFGPPVDGSTWAIHDDTSPVREVRRTLPMSREQSKK